MGRNYWVRLLMCAVLMVAPVHQSRLGEIIAPDSEHFEWSGARAIRGVSVSDAFIVLQADGSKQKCGPKEYVVGRAGIIYSHALYLTACEGSEPHCRQADDEGSEDVHRGPPPGLSFHELERFQGQRGERRVGAQESHCHGDT